MSDDINRGVIRLFISKELRPGATISDSESLLESGTLDSMGVTRLVSFLEERFGIEVADEVFEPDNFETVESIANMVARLKQASA